MPNTKRKKRFKAYMIVSSEGIMYDANGKSMSLAVYAKPEQISVKRRQVMIEGDEVIECTITY